MERTSSFVENIWQFLGFETWNTSALNSLIIFGIIFCLAFLLEYVMKKVAFPVISHIVSRTKASWDDILFDRKLIEKLISILPAVIIYSFLPLAFSLESELEMNLLALFRKVIIIYIIVKVLQAINLFWEALYLIASEKEAFRDRPMKGLYQVALIITYFIGGIVIISELLSVSPTKLFAGLGASAAVLMLIFKDSILGLVSGIQLSANNMVRVGDWITVPKYGADGTVLEISLNTVKVRNFDNTIVMLPPYALIAESFQNWRGMVESGGRRVKRSISIDMDSVRFCTPEMLEKYKNISLINEYILSTEQRLKEYNLEKNVDDSVLVNGMRQTNLGVFRAYIECYLKSLTGVNQNLTCMVRQLQPTETGIPIELYFFTSVTNWILYEKTQADVFDHLLAVVREFDLQVFQSPSGSDFKQIRK